MKKSGVGKKERLKQKTQEALRRDSAAANSIESEPEEQPDDPIPQEFLNAWKEDYHWKTERAVEFARFLYRPRINPRLRNWEIRGALEKCLAEAGKTGDPAAFVKFFETLRDHIQLSDVGRACYLHLRREWKGPLTKQRYREFVTLKARRLGFKPSDRDLRRMEIDIGLGNALPPHPHKYTKSGYSDTQRRMDACWRDWLARQLA